MAAGARPVGAVERKREAVWRACSLSLGSDSSEDGDGDGDGGGGKDRGVAAGRDVGSGPEGPGGAEEADGKGSGAQQGAGGGGGGVAAALPNPLEVLGDDAVVRQGVVLGPRATNADVKGGDAWDSGSDSDRG